MPPLSARTGAPLLALPRALLLALSLAFLLPGTASAAQHRRDSQAVVPPLPTTGTSARAAEVPAARPVGRSPERTIGPDPSTVEQERDPFALSEKMLRLADRPDVPIPPLPAFTPLEKAVKIPKMHLRGLLHGAKGEILALLEIEKGGVYLVREGDSVGLHEFGVDSVIRIQKIDRLHLVVESGTLGQLIIVR